MIEMGEWQARHMSLNPEKLGMMWQLIQRHKTLFSDLTKGDEENFVAAITAPNSMWFEILKHDTVVGIIYFSDMHQVIDCNIHMVFFDRMPAEKYAVTKELIRWMFDNFPLQRMTSTPPEIYFATIKLAKRIGFRLEGSKREAVLLGGKWLNQTIFGITRSEVGAMV